MQRDFGLKNFSLSNPIPQQKQLTSILLTGLVALAIGAGGTAIAQSEPVKGGDLVVGLETDVRGFDTVKGGVYGISGRTVAGAMLEPLVMFTEDRTFAPHLATSWSSSDDGLSWTVNLRDDVKFHDGSEFDAADVAAHFNRILDKKNKSRARGFITAIKNVEVAGPHTAKFNLAHPWQGFLATLADRDMAGLIESPEQTAADKQNREPVGTGPFIFKEWQAGDRIIVTRNPHYWDKDKIHLDKITYRLMPDPQTRFQTLQSGDADVIWTDRGSSILKAEKDKTLEVFVQNGAGSGLTILNASKPPLDNPLVRQAIRHAMSQEYINATLWKNTKPFGTHPLPHECGDVAYLQYDLEKAKALVKKFGKPIKLEFQHTATTRGQEAGAIVQHFLQKAGIDVELTAVDQTTYVKKVFANDYMMTGWRVSDAIDIGPQLFGLSHSESPYNITRLKSPELDRLSLAMRTAKDPETRQKLQCELVTHINKAGHMAFSARNRYHVIHRSAIKGMRNFSLGTPYVWYLWRDNG